MADHTSASDGAAGELPPAVIEFAGKMYNAARTGDIEVFKQALPAGLPPNMRNEKGDTLVGFVCSCELWQLCQAQLVIVPDHARRLPRPCSAGPAADAARGQSQHPQ